MTVVEAIADRLSTIAEVSAIVAERIYAVKLPQDGDLPAIRIQRIDEDEGMHLRGSSGLHRARVQVDSVTEEASGVDARADAIALDAAVHGDGAGSGLCGWRGDIGSPPFTITGILPAGVREGYDAAELRQYKVMRDYWVSFRT